MPSLILFMSELSATGALRALTPLLMWRAEVGASLRNQMCHAKYTLIQPPPPPWACSGHCRSL